MATWWSRGQGLACPPRAPLVRVQLTESGAVVVRTVPPWPVTVPDMGGG